MPNPRHRPTPTLSLAAAILLCTAASAGCTSQSDGPAAASSPSRAPDPSPTMTIPDGQVEAPPGTYALPIAGRKPTGGPMQALVQLPQGYQVGDGGWYIQSGPKDTAPDWNGLAVWDVKGVYSHPCQEGATPVDPGPSVTDLAKAIAAQPMRAASDPIPVRIAGYEGQYVQWSVPDDADFSQCPGGRFNSYTDALGGTRWQQGPGQVDRLWILDVEGNRVVINAFHGPESTKDQIAAVTEMVDTITISTAT